MAGYAGRYNLKAFQEKEKPMMKKPMFLISSYTKEDMDMLLEDKKGLHHLMLKIDQDAEEYFLKWKENYHDSVINNKIKNDLFNNSIKKNCILLVKLLKLFYYNFCKNLTKKDIAPPVYSIWSTTFQCNATCFFCGYVKENKKRFPKPSNESALVTLDNIISNVSGIYFSGGEPLIHPKINEFIQMAFDGGMKPVILNTNGILIGPKMIDNEIQSGNKSLSCLDYLIVSVHSIDPNKINKVFRSSNGVYDALNQLRYIHILKRMQKILGFKLMINTVIREDNIDDIYKILEWAKKNDIYANFVPEMGREPLFNNKEYMKLANYILSQKRLGLRIFGDYIMLKKLLLGRDFSCYPSVRVHIQIDNNGEYSLVFPCIQKPRVYIPIKDIIEGNHILLEINNKTININLKNKSWWDIIKQLEKNDIKMACDQGSCYMAQNLSTELLFNNNRMIIYFFYEGILNFKRLLIRRMTVLDKIYGTSE
ncbi:MAG: radical SAM protein [Chloroflexi bacterium]|nr:radical SAM protein [Chloroflexota bacterium]